MQTQLRLIMLATPIWSNLSCFVLAKANKKKKANSRSLLPIGWCNLKILRRDI